jgi:ABC-2 type transport system ATP-binding protein
LNDALAIGEQVQIVAPEQGVLVVRGISAARIGEIAAASGLVLHELTPLQATLEDAFMNITQDAVEYHAVSDTERPDLLAGATA